MADVYVVVEYDYDCSNVVGIYTDRTTADIVADFANRSVDVIELDVIPPPPDPEPSPMHMTTDEMDEMAALRARERAQADRYAAALRARESAPQHLVMVGGVQVVTPKAD